MIAIVLGKLRHADVYTVKTVQLSHNMYTNVQSVSWCIIWEYDILESILYSRSKSVSDLRTHLYICFAATAAAVHNGDISIGSLSLSLSRAVLSLNLAIGHDFASSRNSSTPAYRYIPAATQCDALYLHAQGKLLYTYIYTRPREPNWRWPLYTWCTVFLRLA